MRSCWAASLHRHMQLANCRRRSNLRKGPPRVLEHCAHIASDLFSLCGDVCYCCSSFLRGMLGIVQLGICLAECAVYDVSIIWSRDVVQDADWFADTEFLVSMCVDRAARGGHIFINVFNTLSLISALVSAGRGDTRGRGSTRQLYLANAKTKWNGSLSGRLSDSP